MNLLINKFLIFLSFTLTSFAQQTFYVKNIKSGDPISYTFIYNENRTFKINAELDGSFQIPEIYLNDVFTFESVGYELMQTELDSEIIYLEDNSDLLEELIITKRLSSKEIRVGNKATKKHSSFVFNEENVFSLMTFGIKCSANRNLYPFVKEIHLKTRSKISTAKFEIQIYGIGADGKPRDLLHQQPIYGIAGKGISTTIVDVQSLNIQNNV